MVTVRKRRLRPRVEPLDVVNYVLLFLFSVSVVYPFWSQLVVSLSTVEEAMRPSLHILPLRIVLDSYVRVLSSSLIGSAFFWTIARTALGTAITLVLCFTVAYPLSRRNLWKRNFWTGLIVFTMFFSGGLVPAYLLIRSLGMMNTIWALVLPGAVVPYNIVIIRNYMMSLSEELAESARIDGANDARILWSIVLPLCIPILATVALWTVVGHWNAWFDAMIYIQKPPIRVLQELLRSILNETQMQSGGDSLNAYLSEQMGVMQYTPSTIRAAMLMIVTFPILCTYPFLQKYFVKGIMMGSLKG